MKRNKRFITLDGSVNKLVTVIVRDPTSKKIAANRKSGYARRSAYYLKSNFLPIANVSVREIPVLDAEFLTAIQIDNPVPQ